PAGRQCRCLRPHPQRRYRQRVLSPGEETLPVRPKPRQQAWGGRTGDRIVHDQRRHPHRSQQGRGPGEPLKSVAWVVADHGQALETPKTKLQTPNKLQASSLKAAAEHRFGIWSLGVLWSLEFGVWDFVAAQN